MNCLKIILTVFYQLCVRIYILNIYYMCYKVITVIKFLHPQKMKVFHNIHNIHYEGHCFIEKIIEIVYEIEGTVT